MGIMLFFALLWLIYAIYQIKSGIGDIGDLMLGVLTLIFSGLLTLALSSLFIDITPTHYEIVDKHNLVAVADNYYASGIINSSGKLFYTVMTETERGYEAENIDASMTTISFGEGKPVLIEEKKVFNSKFLNWLLFPGVSARYTIYIPENSISMKFNIDLS